MIIGNEFIEVFAEEARKLDGIEFLAQGNIWPDILESEEGGSCRGSATPVAPAASVGPRAWCF